jgi:ribosome biogenesis protein BMS1
VQHPYVLADRFEDLTPAEAVRQNPLCDRRIALFGYLRGCNLKPGTHVHLAGVGDFALSDVSSLPDPCPLPGSTGKRRSLDDRERLLYAPMSDVGRLTYDKDAMYVNLADHTVNFSKPEADEDGAPGRSAMEHIDTPGVQMVRELQEARQTVDEKLRASHIQLFRHSLHADGLKTLNEDGSDEESGSDDDSDGGDSDEEAWSDEDGAPAQAEQPPAAGGSRVRRRAVFGAATAAAAADSDSSSDSDSDSEGAYGDHAARGEDAAEEGLGGASRWKDGLARHAATLHTKLDLMVRAAAVDATATPRVCGWVMAHCACIRPLSDKMRLPPLCAAAGCGVRHAGRRRC